MTTPRIYGGRGAWFFILPLFLLMTGGTFYFARQFQASDQQKTALLHQEELHTQEIQSLRAQVDKLQSELSEVGSIAQEKEAQLRQKEATLESVKNANEQRETEAKIVVQKKELILLEHQKKLAQKLKGFLESKLVSTHREQLKLIVTIPNGTLFDAGSEALKLDSAALLTVLGGYLQELPPEVEARIASHHDTTPLQGTLAQKYPTILELTTARATAVAKAMIKIANLLPKRILSVGMGESQPVAPNDDPQKKLLNRRIEVIFDLSPIFQESSGKK